MGTFIKVTMTELFGGEESWINVKFVKLLSVFRAEGEVVTRIFFHSDLGDDYIEVTNTPQDILNRLAYAARTARGQEAEEIG